MSDSPAAVLTVCRGSNLPPSSSNRDDTPRSASRILNAFSAREKFRERGGRTAEDTGEYKPKKKKKAADAVAEGSKSVKELVKVSVKGKEKEKTGNDIPSILPHEKLGDYNRRIEALLRPGVSKAIKDAGAIRTDQVRAAKEAKDKRKKTSAAPVEEEEADGNGKGKRKRIDNDHLEPEDRPVKTFAPIPAPRRLNDIAQAPPQLPHLRQAGKTGQKVKGASAFSTVGRDPLNAGQKRLLEEERERVVKRYREMREEREAEKSAARR